MSDNSLTAAQSGVYRTPEKLDVARARAKALDWVELPLGEVTDKTGFMTACKTALKLPAHFGNNWDALADCLGDAGVLGAGKVLHLSGAAQFAKAAGQEYLTALNVLSETADYWKGKGNKPFVVLVDGASNLKAL
jgi:RNAse (barnase) inhibitor barstar